MFEDKKMRLLAIGAVALCAIGAYVYVEDPTHASLRHQCEEYSHLTDHQLQLMLGMDVKQAEQWKFACEQQHNAS